MEIDKEITYCENKKHLLELARMISRSLDVFELARMEELQKQYMAEHFLSYYIMCQLTGETKSEEIGPPNEEIRRFSLRAFTQSSSQTI